MKSALCFVVICSLFVSVLCGSYFFGQRERGTKMVHREKVYYSPFPWQSRVKYYMYNDLEQRKIKAVDCYDLQNTEATVNLTAGGVGQTYFTLQFRSQKSYPLDYAIEIFA